MTTLPCELRARNCQRTHLPESSLVEPETCRPQPEPRPGIPPFDLDPSTGDRCPLDRAELGSELVMIRSISISPCSNFSRSVVRAHSCVLSGRRRLPCHGDLGTLRVVGVADQLLHNGSSLNMPVTMSWARTMSTSFGGWSPADLHAAAVVSTQPAKEAGRRSSPISSSGCSPRNGRRRSMASRTGTGRSQRRRRR